MTIAADRLSTTLSALADPTRRAILARLALRRKRRRRARAAVRHDPARDLQASEGAGARRPDRARPRGAAPAVPARRPRRCARSRNGSSSYRQFWEQRLDRLEEYLSRHRRPSGRASERERAMAAKASDALRTEVRDFTLRRVLNAPRELVFRAFVEPERMRHWWVPRGFTMLSCALDLREGGAWRMTHPVRRERHGADRGRRLSRDPRARAPLLHPRLGARRRHADADHPGDGAPSPSAAARPR